MTSIQNTFKRYELKYMVTQEQREELSRFFKGYMIPDKFGQSTICNIYYDTPDFRLIRHSIEKPVYKEKLRIRSYGKAKSQSPVFIELKKKYRRVVYKRRVQMEEKQALGYLDKSHAPCIQNQITQEIDYVLDYYGQLIPAVYLSYEREALYAKEDKDIRITFDSNILWRDKDISLSSEIYGSPILSSDESLMEIKVAAAIPLWMVERLSKMNIYPVSFSKYGRAYQTMTSMPSCAYAQEVKEEKKERRNHCA